MNLAKTTEPNEMSFGLCCQVRWRSHWQNLGNIWLNRTCAAAMWPCVKWFRRLVSLLNGFYLLWLKLFFLAFTALVGCQKEHPACKNWVMRCWRGYLSAVRCKWFACHCHPIISCFINIQNGFTFLVYPHCPQKEAVQRVSVCVIGLFVEAFTT